MDQRKYSLVRRLTAAAVCVGMLISLAACGKAPAEMAAPSEQFTAEQAIGQLQAQQEALGYENALNELAVKTTTEIGGDTYIRLQQHYSGLPVYGKTVVCAADEEGRLRSVTGNLQDVDPALDLIPTVAAETVSQTATRFFTDTLGWDADDSAVEAVLSVDDLCIYTGGAVSESHLAYRIPAKGYELIIDAHDGALLLSNCLLRQGKTLDLSGQRTDYTDVPVLQEDGEFRLTDKERNITSFQANHTEMSEFWGLLTYQVNIGNDSDEIVWSDGENPPAAAVDAYVNTRAVYDYFDQVLDLTAPDGEGNCQILLLTGTEYFLDEDEQIKSLMDNAHTFTSPQQQATMLSFGIGTDGKPSHAAHIDWVAHEYMHAVEQYHSAMVYDGESGAITEGLSDIFGELAESWQNSQAPNWNFTDTDRNMRNPGTNGYPAAAGDPIAQDSDFVHGYSTVISHSAYLMWNGIDGTAEKKLTGEQLAELWYRAMLMMPSDCDFILCRKLVGIAAGSMEDLTEQQLACVEEAFDRVGIASSRDALQAEYKLAEDGTLTVYDRNNVPYSGYTLRISGTVAMEEIASNMTPDVGWVVSRTVTVAEAGPWKLELPQGVYTLTVTDPHYDEEYTVSVEISRRHTETNIDLITAYEEPLVVVLPEIDFENMVNDVHSDAFTDTDGWKCCYHIPQFRLPDDLAQAVNGKIYDYCTNVLDQEVYAMLAENYSPNIGGIAYSWGHHGEFASVLIRKQYSIADYNEFIPLTISAVTGQEVTMDVLLAEFGLDRDGFYSLVRSRLEQYWNERSIHRTDAGADFFDDRVSRTLADENIRKAVPYIDADGGLSFTANIYSLAGGDSYWHLIGSEGQLEYEYPRCSQNHAFRTIVSPNDPLEYFIEFCDRRYFTEAEIMTFDQEMCVIARNAIYAKSGRIFTTEKLSSLFRKYSWYNPTVSGDDFREDMLNSYQIANRELVVGLENVLKSGTPDISDVLLYFIENCDRRYFTAAELSDLSAEELVYARNAIYAKSGRIFSSEKFGYFFRRFSWYIPSISAEEFSESILNEYQTANRDLILTLENGTNTISPEQAYAIACEYWDYHEGDIADETGFELYLVDDGMIEYSGTMYYFFRLRWLVVGEDGTAWLSTVDQVYVHAETGECFGTI